MWINKQFFEMLITDNKKQQEEIATVRAFNASLAADNTLHIRQHTRDVLMVDWLRHRVNALEKQNAVLMQKAAGIAMPTPEIVLTKPGEPIDFSTMPSFEDVGESEAIRLGISHSEDGTLNYTK